MSRIANFCNNYYHIYNRGVDKREVFLEDKDYVRFLMSLKFFNQTKPFGSFYEKMYCDRTGWNTYRCSNQLVEPKIVKIIAYCLNQNYYHLILQTLKTNGISEFMKKIGSGYTRYFNNKYKRSGSLFEGKYKAKEINSTYDLMKVSIYVNCNAEIHGILKKEEWIWSSYLDYVGLRKGILCDKKDVMDEFQDITEYKKLCEELIPKIRKIKYL